MLKIQFFLFVIRGNENDTKHVDVRMVHGAWQKKPRDVQKKMSGLERNKPKQNTQVDVCVQVGNGSFDTRA